MAPERPSFIAPIADDWRGERDARQRRRQLDPADFERLREAGLTRLTVPVAAGGGWVSVEESVRPIAEALRLLGAADPSPALVSAMHPSVLSFWLANEAPASDAWEQQRAAVCRTVIDGAQWGTVTSEPGSGGDVTRSRATATLSEAVLADLDVPGRRYLVTGDKHFGSGTGVCTYMLTTAVPEGETKPTAFFIDTRELRAGRDQPGFSIAKEWDGVGMSATQSHAVRLDRCPGVRIEWPDSLESMLRGAGPVNHCLFTAVVLGVLDEAVRVARDRLGRQVDDLRPYERVEWARATTDHWVAEQIFEGMLRTLETGDRIAALHAGMRGKTAVAELAEGALLRITRVIGGGTFSASSPFASWFSDVRALGFLRPPWGLAFDGLIAASL
jgi:alkylation response protein AidB-like acyl-CoA dehydrogenase